MAINEVVARQFRFVAAALAINAALVTTVSIALGDDFIGFGSVIDIAIFLGLAYGVYRKSRAASIVLFAYHSLNRVLLYRSTGDMGTLLGVASLTGALVFLMGILGTFSQRRGNVEGREHVKAVKLNSS